jgi:hypothetical protein
MDSLESLLADFAVDSDTVGHGLTTGEGLHQSVLIIESGG